MSFIKDIDVLYILSNSYIIVDYSTDKHYTACLSKPLRRVDVSSFRFTEPTSAHDAVQRLTQLKADTKNIHDQISDAGSDADPDWLYRVRVARRMKRNERAFLTQWLYEYRQKKSGDASTLVGIDLTSHLKSHRKLVGELHNLLIAVEDHLRNDTGTNLVALREIVDRIRAIK